MNTDTKIKELERELADMTKQSDDLGEHIEANHRIGLIRERELADALTALAMLGDRHERDLAQSKEANAGLMRACDKLELELLNAKENIGMLEIRHGATMLCHQAQMDEITKQRDELASALKSLCITIISEEPCDITDLLKQSEAALAATKGGSHEKYTNNR